MAQHNHDQKALEAMIAQLKAENEALKAKKVAKAGATVTENGLSIRVSEKKAVSVYGLGRFPVTLYGEQMVRLAAAMPEILAFIAENKDKLAVKPAKAESKTEAA